MASAGLKALPSNHIGIDVIPLRGHHCSNAAGEGSNAVGDFRFVVCNIFVLIRHLVARSHCRDSCACMHQSCRGCNKGTNFTHF